MIQILCRTITQRVAGPEKLTSDSFLFQSVHKQMHHTELGSSLAESYAET